MKKRCLVFVLLAMVDFSSPTAAEEMPPSLEQAQQAFFQGDYATAAQRFDAAALQRQDWPGSFYLNQGNAHFLAGHWGAALLAYRRAELLLPQDHRVRENLAEARSRVAENTLALYPQAPWWRELLRFSGWSAFLAHLLACLVLLRCWQRAVWPRASLMLIILGWAVGALWLTGVLLDEAENAQPWVVVLTETPLRQGNGPSYPPQEKLGKPIFLRPGVEGRGILRKRNGWVFMELAGGLRGWVPEKALGFVKGIPEMR
jgi:hypothetical protein